MSTESPKSNTKKQNSFNTQIAAVVAQVGCVTLVTILGAIFGGMALDKQYGTTPKFTVGLLLASIPISLALMVVFVKRAIAKIKITEQLEKANEEEHIGKES